MAEVLWSSPDDSRRLVANGRTLARLDQFADCGQWIDTCVLDAGDARALRALADERTRLERERDALRARVSALADEFSAMASSYREEGYDLFVVSAVEGCAGYVRPLLARPEAGGEEPAP